jgi:hypothetical protein
MVIDVSFCDLLAVFSERAQLHRQCSTCMFLGQADKDDACDRPASESRP